MNDFIFMYLKYLVQCVINYWVFFLMVSVSAGLLNVNHSKSENENVTSGAYHIFHTGI